MAPLVTAMPTPGLVESTWPAGLSEACFVTVPTPRPSFSSGRLGLGQGLADDVRDRERHRLRVVRGQHGATGSQGGDDEGDQGDHPDLGPRRRRLRTRSVRGPVKIGTAWVRLMAAMVEVASTSLIIAASGSGASTGSPLT